MLEREIVYLEPRLVGTFSKSCRWKRTFDRGSIWWRGVDLQTSVEIYPAQNTITRCKCLSRTWILPSSESCLRGHIVHAVIPVGTRAGNKAISRYSSRLAGE